MAYNIFITTEAKKTFLFGRHFVILNSTKNNTTNRHIFTIRHFATLEKLTLIALHLRSSRVRHVIVSECRKLNITGM